MQQWLDKSISQNNSSNVVAGYESPDSDAVSDANNFRLSPVALSNDDSGLTGVSGEFPQQYSAAEQCIQSVNLADLLLNAASTTAECVPQQPVHLDSVQPSASQLPGGQITYVLI